MSTSKTKNGAAKPRNPTSNSSDTANFAKQKSPLYKPGAFVFRQSKALAKIEMDEKGCLTVVVCDSRDGNDNMSLVSTNGNTITFDADASLRTVLALADPHFDDLASFYADDVRRLSAEHKQRVQKYAAQVAELVSDLERVGRLNNILLKLLTDSEKGAIQ